MQRKKCSRVECSLNLRDLEKRMETDTRALEVVCKHFRNECGDATIANLRKRLNKAHVENHRLRKKALQLSSHLERESSCRAILNTLISILLRRMDSVLDSAQRRIGDE